MWLLMAIHLFIFFPPSVGFVGTANNESEIHKCEAKNANDLID